MSNGESSSNENGNDFKMNITYGYLLLEQHFINYGESNILFLLLQTLNEGSFHRDHYLISYFEGLINSNNYTCTIACNGDGTIISNPTH